MTVLIVGAGLSGATIARRLAEAGKPVLVIDSRNHIGGNCYDQVDPTTGIRWNLYGAHLFHTNNERVWEFVQQYSKWIRWEHTVLAKVEGRHLPFPANITTVNALCHENIQTPAEMATWLSGKVYRGEIKNSKDMARSRVGDELYERLVRGYTKKQWDKDPSELHADVLARIPFRDDFDTRYFKDRYQALPKNGYTAFFENLLDHPLITVRLETDFFGGFCRDIWEAIVYTGPIDAYFSQILPERLEYRSIDFQVERRMNVGYHQPCAVVNHPDMDVPWTRVVEYKHFWEQESPHTLIVREVTNDDGPGYYPVPTQRNRDLYARFQTLAEKEEGVAFVGRLAQYKYFNMDQAILSALEWSDGFLNAMPR